MCEVKRWVGMLSHGQIQECIAWCNPSTNVEEDPFYSYIVYMQCEGFNFGWCLKYLGCIFFEI